MSLFVKHVADKQQFHVTIPCFSLTLRRLPTQSRSRHFGGVSEKKTRSDHVTRHALVARNNEACAQANGRGRSVQSFAIIRTLDTVIFLLAVFKLELEMDYPSEMISLCTVAPSPTDTPSSIFSEGSGRLYIGYLKRII